MTPNARKYLDDMLERARFLAQLSQEESLIDMETNRLLRSAVERELMIVGEALYLLNSESPETAQQINSWRDIIAMRHKLVHGYSTVAPPIMQDVIENKIPSLIAQLETMLASE